jgi:hypothetical protein
MLLFINVSSEWSAVKSVNTSFEIFKVVIVQTVANTYIPEEYAASIFRVEVS